MNTFGGCFASLLKEVIDAKKQIKGKEGKELWEVELSLPLHYKLKIEGADKVARMGIDIEYVILSALEILAVERPLKEEDLLTGRIGHEISLLTSRRDKAGAHKARLMQDFCQRVLVIVEEHAVAASAPGAASGEQPEQASLRFERQTSALSQKLEALFDREQSNGYKVWIEPDQEPLREINDRRTGWLKLKLLV